VCMYDIIVSWWNVNESVCVTSFVILFTVTKYMNVKSCRYVYDMLLNTPCPSICHVPQYVIN
jgi:hypothetical protein